MEKRYRMEARLAAPFSRKGQFSFRVSYGLPLPGGGNVIVNQTKCPVITLPVGGVVSTSNFTAQTMIENFKTPTKTVRNGARREAGFLFTDVTGETEPGDEDVNLDSLLPSSR